MNILLKVAVFDLEQEHGLEIIIDNFLINGNYQQSTGCSAIKLFNI